MPSTFAVDWLELREGHDHRARLRPAALWPRAASITTSTRTAGAALDCIDLACGTGSNIRMLAPRLGGRQCWRAFDADAGLLQAMPESFERWSRRHQWCFGLLDDGFSVCGDTFQIMVRPVEADLSAGLSAPIMGAADLITASALLDLVSERWLAAWVSHAASLKAEVHWALSYDGRLRWRHPDPDDAWVIEAFHRHQHRDKGFGPALGPEAAARARELLRRAGYRVRSVRSDWRLGADDASMERRMIDGLAHAAAEMEPGRGDQIRRWRERRRAICASVGSGLQVGHRDIDAWPES